MPFDSRDLQALEATDRRGDERIIVFSDARAGFKPAPTEDSAFAKGGSGLRKGGSEIAPGAERQDERGEPVSGAGPSGDA